MGPRIAPLGVNPTLIGTCTEVSRALQQFVFECMRLTTVDDAGAYPTAEQDRQLDIPWDDPYPYYSGLMPAEPPDDDPLRCPPAAVDDDEDDAASQSSDIRAGR